MIKKNDVPETIWYRCDIWGACYPTLKLLYVQELDPKLPQIITRYTKNVITVNLNNTPRL